MDTVSLSPRVSKPCKSYLKSNWTITIGSCRKKNGWLLCRCLFIWFCVISGAKSGTDVVLVVKIGLRLRQLDRNL